MQVATMQVSIELPCNVFFWGSKMSVLHRIRQLVIDRRYYFSAHAEEEMWADG